MRARLIAVATTVALLAAINGASWVRPRVQLVRHHGATAAPVSQPPERKP